MYRSIFSALGIFFREIIDVTYLYKSDLEAWLKIRFAEGHSYKEKEETFLHTRNITNEICGEECKS